MLQIKYSNNITVSGYGAPLMLRVTDDLTIPNPEYEKAKRQRRPTWGIPQKLRLYLRDADGNLIVPRGYAWRLENHIKDLNVIHETATDLIGGNVTDFGDWNKAFILRDYQIATLDALLNSNGIIVAPAGSGKTIMGMAYIRAVKRPTLWLTHTKDLMYQTKARAEATLQNVGKVGLYGDGHKDAGYGKLIIATVQTLRDNEALIQQLNEFIGVVVIDEAHHFPAAQFIDTAAKFKAARIIGLTATPDRKDGLQTYMYMGIGPLLHTVNRAELYADEQLTKPEVRFVYTKFADTDDSGAAGNVDAGGDDLDYAALIGRLIQDKDRIELIASNIVRAKDEGPAIVLAESVRYCFKLEQAVQRIANEQNVTISTAVVHGGLQRYTWRMAASEDEAIRQARAYGTDYKYDNRRWKVKVPQYTAKEYEQWRRTPTQRKQLIQAAVDGKIDILFATQLAREGLDIPRLTVGHCVMPKRGDDANTKTGAALEQEIGRIMRPDPDNPDKHAVWYDYVDINVGVFKSQYYSRRRTYKRLGIPLASKPKNAERDLIEKLLDDIKM